MTLSAVSFALLGGLFAVAVGGCQRSSTSALPVTTPPAVAGAVTQRAEASVGFDRNVYPGDARLLPLRQHFAFMGYWLTPPPGETTNSWRGKRVLVRDAGFGFLLLANGRLDAEIKRSTKSAAALGASDGQAAIASAQTEGFPRGATIFLDQEEGGRLLPEQAAYFFGWTEAVAASAYRPGAYLSGQRDPDGTGPDGKPAFITTAQDVREHITHDHLHPVALFVYNDACPPAPGCTAAPPDLAREAAISGVADAVAWQYAQSPRRASLTASCAKTYAPDGQCYGGASDDLFLDLDVAASNDPSHAR